MVDFDIQTERYYVQNDEFKAELLPEGIFSFPHPFICQRHFSNEKVGNRKNKPTFIISVLKVEY